MFTQCDIAIAGVCYTTANMRFSGTEIEEFRPRLRVKVRYHVGFACPDVEDIVQETLARFLLAAQNGKLNDVEAVGGYLNGICQNVIFEYRRRWARAGPDSAEAPERADQRVTETELFEMREAIAAALRELAPRDRQILRAFFLEERSKSEILSMMGLSEENFRVVLCRAKDRFRQIYVSAVKHSATSGQ